MMVVLRQLYVWKAVYNSQIMLRPACPKNATTLCPSHRNHSHTFPNKSSLPPPNPPPPPLPLGFVATGLAWLHPPNSSSCCTLKPAPPVEVVLGAAGFGTSPQPLSNGV